MSKVAVIGLGPVGATIASRIVQRGLVSQLVLIDLNEQKAKSEVLDLNDASSLLATYTRVSAGAYDDLAEVDVVILAFGNMQLSLETGNRFAELQGNAAAVKSITGELKRVGFKGKLLVASNPNDILTQFFASVAGLPYEHVIGTGCLLDCMRMKHYVGEVLGLDSKSIDGFVVGEHGPTQVIAWSSVNVYGKSIFEYAKEMTINFDDLAKKIINGGFSVVAGKGYTNVAIAESTVHLLEALLNDAKRVLSVTHYNKEHDIYISTPAIIGKNGVEGVVELKLNETEMSAFMTSVATIQQQKKQIED